MRGQEGIKKLLSELILGIPALNALDNQLPHFEANEQELELGRALQLSVDLLIEQVLIQQRRYELLSETSTLGCLDLRRRDFIQEKVQARVESRVEVGLLSHQRLDHLQVLFVAKDPVREDLFVLLGLARVACVLIDLF